MNDPTKTYSWLPRLLREIAQVAGIEAALKLAESHGGRRVDIPARLTDECWLVKAVGRPAAEAIAAQLGAGRLDIPLGPAGSYARLRRQLNDRYEALEGRSSMATIAQELGITERAVRKRRAKRRGQAASRQQSLL